MTNFERIKEMNIEEMAEFHSNNCDCTYCVCYPEPGPCSLSCKAGVKKWLESEAATGKRQINNKTE